MISIYWHVTVILLLLTAHGLTVRWALRHIRDLRLALVARRALLGEDVAVTGYDRTHALLADEKLVLADTKENILEIHTTDATTITVRVFDR